MNDRGQLGAEDENDRNVPTRVEFGYKVEMEMISAGQVHTMALGIKMDDAD